MTVIDSLYNCFKHWSSKGSVYIYSDPHFGDLDSYIFRGFIQEKGEVNDLEGYTGKIYSSTVEGFNYDWYYLTENSVKSLVKYLDEMQIKNINSKCHKNDTLIILGDVGDIEWVKKIKAGHKVLIMGNHDKGASNYKRIVIQDDNTCPVCGNKVFQDYRTLYNCGEDYAYCYQCHSTVKYVSGKINDNHLFDEVYEGPLIISPKIILSHEPINIPYCLNIHGHCHTKIDMINDDKHLNCCAEWIDYKPMSLSKIIDNGYLKNIDDIHRCTIDKATTRKLKRKEN